MRKTKKNSNSVLKIIATMRLAKSMNCSYEEAETSLKKMSAQG